MRWPEAWTTASLVPRLREAGVDAIFLDAQKLPEVADAARGAGLAILPPGEPPAGVALIKGSWPGVKGANGAGGADAGPTGAPWIDANTWLVQLERVRRPGMAVWVDTELPKDLKPGFPLVLPFADAAMCGGQWIVALPETMARALLSGDEAAVAAGKRVSAAAAFFQEHAAWRTYQPVARLAVLSSFSGEGEYLSTEVLNLTARLNQPFRPVLLDSFTPMSLDGIRAVIYAEPREPAPPVRQALLRFVEQGGLLLLGSSWSHLGGKPLPALSEQDGAFQLYRFFQIGRGRVAVSKEEWNDPYLVANEAKVICTGEMDLFRWWNLSACGSYLTRSPDGKTLLQVVNYVTHPSRYAPTLFVAGSYREARLWRLGDAAPAALQLIPVRGGVEMELPPIPVYAAVELA